MGNQAAKPGDKSPKSLRIKLQKELQANGLLLKAAVQKYSGYLTYKMCLIAVRDNGLALEFVPKRYQTERMYWEAVGQNPLAYQFVDAVMKNSCTHKAHVLRIYALKRDYRVLKYIREQRIQKTFYNEISFNYALFALEHRVESIEFVKPYYLHEKIYYKYCIAYLDKYRNLPEAPLKNLEFVEKLVWDKKIDILEEFLSIADIVKLLNMVLRMNTYAYTFSRIPTKYLPYLELYANVKKWSIIICQGYDPQRSSLVPLPIVESFWSPKRRKDGIVRSGAEIVISNQTTYVGSLDSIFARSSLYLTRMDYTIIYGRGNREAMIYDIYTGEIVLCNH